MAGDDFTDNNVINDPLNQYRAIFGIPSRRRIIFGAACIFFILTLIVIAFALKSKQDNSKNVKVPYALFRNAVDVSVDPCVDFYNFTCGLWTQSNPANENLPRVTTFSLLQNHINDKKKAIFESAKQSDDFPRIVNSAINFYDRCVQQNSTSDSDLLLQYLDQMGGWPILNEFNWDETTFDLLEHSAFLIKNFDVHSIIGVYSTDSDQIGDKNVIYLKAPTLLEDDDLNWDEITILHMIYVVVKTLNNSYVNQDIVEDIESLKITTMKWKKLLTLPHKISDKTFISIEELSKQIPEFDWLNYLQLVTNDTLLKINETLTIHDVIAIDDLDYLKKIVNVINSDIFTKREWANLFGWFVLKNIWILIPGVLENYANLNNYDSEDMKIAATIKCYDLVLELFPSALDYIYVKNLSHAGIQDNKVLTNFLKLTFQDIIQESHWLDEVTKSSILHRIGDMKNIIGFPNYLNNKTEFDELYKDFPEIHDYKLNCYFQAVQFYVKMRILQYKIMTKRKKVVLPRPVSDVSAYYIVYQNSLVYPISLHNPPFYYFKGPPYLNFGAIGSVIGHEMMHGIDCTGIQGKDRNVSWFTDKARVLYKKHASCFKDQYSIYDNLGDYKNNGTNTLRENIADSEGLRLAFEAYKRYERSTGLDQRYMALNNYTPDQMFFIAFGTVWCSRVKPSIKEQVYQLHSSPDIRVNKAVSNSEPFALAFDCPKGSPMNPSEKCLIW